MFTTPFVTVVVTRLTKRIEETPLRDCELLVVVLLSLAAYQYADLMLAEAKVMENVHRSAQTRAFAES